MSTVYGINATSAENEVSDWQVKMTLNNIYDKHLQYILMAEAALETVSMSSGLGSSLVNIFPIRKTLVFRSRLFVD